MNGPGLGSSALAVSPWQEPTKDFLGGVLAGQGNEAKGVTRLGTHSA